MRPLLRSGRLCAAAVVLCALASSEARAQDSTAIGGRVNGPGGTPLANARVQVTTERGSEAEALSDSSGRYRVRVPRHGAVYVVSAEAPGVNPVTRLVAAPAGGAELTVDLALLSRSVPLQPIVVRVPRLTVAGATELSPGSTEQSRSGYELQGDPLGSDDLADLTGREIGIARTATPDGPGLSIAGQDPGQTRLTLDGGDTPQGPIPREAVREANVLTNPYDVGRGRFTGGQLDVRTQAAGNRWGASIRLDRRDPRLQYGGAPREARARATHTAVDGGGGGALIRDRLFAFGAFTVRDTRAAGQTLDDPGGAGGALGVSGDSVARFLAVTAPIRPPRAGTNAQGFTLGSGLLRLDAVLSPHHTLVARVNGAVSRNSDPGSGWAVSGTGSEMRGSSLGALALLSSGNGRAANELRLNLTGAAQSWSGADPAPLGVVQVVSSSAGGHDLADLRFAGSPLAGSGARQRSAELSDQVVLTTRDRDHRVRLGAELGGQEHLSLALHDAGSFYFSSLADLQGNRPALFTRSFHAMENAARLRRAAFFADDHWRLPGVDLSVGIRAERAWYPREGAANPGVEARFGLEPGVVPSPWLLSPRGGFTAAVRMPWDRADRRSELSGGLGDFVGALPLSALAGALGERGLADDAQLVCAGPSAPLPDWAAYRRDPASIPSTCTEGFPGFGSSLPAATVFARGFRPPRVRRGSLGGQGVLPWGGVMWKVTGSLVQGVHQPAAFDRNLRRAPAFINTTEGGRAVYVPAGAIDSATGGVSASASRLYPELGTVREVTAAGRSRAVQLGASVFRLVGQGWVEGGYTWTDARQTVATLDAPGSGPASAGATAEGLVWAPAEYAPRHVLFVFVLQRLSRSLRAGFTGHLASGTPFTPMTAGDVNGDGVSNDRAFVFAPAAASAPAGVGEGMAHLLGSAPANVRSCLEAQAGRIAEPNSCRTGWSPSLDLNAQLQVGKRIDGSPHRRVTLWASAQNVTAGLDYLLHGPERLRGWGQHPSVNTTLLAVRGWDAGSRRFRYEVNQRFGRPGQGGLLARSPFALSIQARVVVGNDHVLAAALRELDDHGREALTPERLRRYLVQQWTNVPAEALSQNAPRRLYLTPAQVARLQLAADSVVARREPVLRELTQALTGARRYDAQTIERVRALRAEAIALRNAGAEAVRAVLTAEQWIRLPETLREPGFEFSTFPPQVITRGDAY